MSRRWRSIWACRSTVSGGKACSGARRNGTPTAPILFESPDGRRRRSGGAGRPGVRRRFRQVSADLSVRGCRRGRRKAKGDAAAAATANRPGLSLHLINPGRPRCETSNGRQANPHARRNRGRRARIKPRRLIASSLQHNSASPAGSLTWMPQQRRPDGRAQLVHRAAAAPDEGEVVRSERVVTRQGRSVCRHAEQRGLSSPSAARVGPSPAYRLIVPLEEAGHESRHSAVARHHRHSLSHLRSSRRRCRLQKSAKSRQLFDTLIR